MPTPPPVPPPSLVLDLPGFTLGHGSDRQALTGTTVILCPEGMTAAAEVRGSATGTRQFDSLVSVQHLGSKAHAVVLSGGSGYGLSAADPVVDWLARRGFGFQTGVAPVPLVPTAILFDLFRSDPLTRPTRALSEAALANAAAGPVAVGSIGAGVGATVGKALGPTCGMKGGFGFASLTIAGVPGGPTVAAAVAVNAFGDVRRLDGTLLAGCRTAPDSLELAHAERVIANLPPEASSPWEGNTTLAVVMTDAILSKPTGLKVCAMAFGGFYRTLSPALSLFDGDLVIVLSSNQRRAHVNQIGILAERAVAEAILTGVAEADGLGVLPAARDRPPLSIR
ncbi:MAG TPA: P1 family peptidase [Thermoanaerobaculia bacterium]|jgi:L-aminopeptidase/D-esterase-like protein|nr:P1 family peptidase [Thermoanaerobaculia bacterium]